jgi:hypothetical protein
MQNYQNAMHFMYTVRVYAVWCYNYTSFVLK